MEISVSAPLQSRSQDDDELSKTITVLLVDDEKGVLRALARLLRQHDVHTADNYEDAVRLLKEQEIDVVVSDCVMPGPGGVQVLRSAQTIRPAAVRVMLSAYPPADLHDLIDQGLLHQFFPKPWTSDLPRRLEELVVSAKPSA